MLKLPRQTIVNLAVRLASGALLCVVAGCSTTRWPMAPAQVSALDAGRTSVKMEQLSTCQGTPNEAVTLDPARPLTLIVHGCNSSAGNYAALAKVFQQQGQQALCFNYDDRDTITRSSSQLRQIVETLAAQAGMKDIAVLGHSQGGLVARRALVDDAGMAATLQAHSAHLRLVTVSTPFGGIRAASHCGSTPLAILSLGLTIPICQLVTGSKWSEIPPNSDFINAPGKLLGAVGSHLKIVTDETGACQQRAPDGACQRADSVFSIDEQRQPVVDHSAGVRELMVKAGHVEIVGGAERVPYKLIAILQQQGMLASTLPPDQFMAMVDAIYASYGTAGQSRDGSAKLPR